MKKLGRLTDLAKALLKVPCPVEALDPANAQELHDKGYITAPKLGHVWTTEKGARAQLRIATAVARGDASFDGLSGPGSEQPICWPRRLYDFPEHAEWVRTEVMWNLREYDRGLTRPDGVARVAASLKRFGFVAPVLLIYYQHDRAALLGEGNHRVAAALMLDMEWCLVRVMRNTRYPGPRHYTSRTPVPVPGAEPNRFGHVNADLKPSEIGLPARPLSLADRLLDRKPIPGVPVPRDE